MTIRFHSFSKRPVALLEVLIAFAIVALAILPLIYPHIFILRSERQFISTIELDHLASHLYANLLQKLYRNEIPWEKIESGEKIPIDESLIRAAGFSGDLAYEGTYHFFIVKQYPEKPAEKKKYLFDLIFTFAEKKNESFKKDDKGSIFRITYKYSVPLERITNG